MKTSVIRFILAALCIFPGLLLCVTFAVKCLSEMYREPSMAAFLAGVPFIACIVIWGWFVKDTFKLYKEGK